MTRIIAFTFVTLDGVMQAPARPDEDERGGFEHGGWAAPYADAVTASMASEDAEQRRGLLFGRRTYEDFFEVWPARADNPFTEILNNAPKFVASRTLREPLPWMNSTLLGDDAEDAVARLREKPGGDLVILGSGELVRSLARRNLIDEYILLIHPLVLGSGQRLFDDGLPATKLRLCGTRTSTTGVVIATYQPAEPTAA